MLAFADSMFDVPGSAYRPFRLDVELGLEADESVCELVRFLTLGIVEYGSGRFSSGK